MTAKDVHHFLLIPAPAWGHSRPICHLALRLLECDPKIVVTILVGPNMLSKTHAEIAEHLPGLKEPDSRIRVVSTFESTEQDGIKIFGGFIQHYPAVYETLYKEKVITCVTSGINYNPVSAPVVVILDFFLLPVLHATRALTGQSVPIISWTTGSPSAVIRLWGPESLGGHGNLAVKAEAEAQRTGLSPDDAGNKLYRKTKGDIISIAGLPPMYDHEFFPQDLRHFMHSVFHILKGGYTFFESCDGVLMSSSYAAEAATIETIKKEWFSKAQKEVYAVGPLLPRTYWSAVQNPRGADEVQIFLNQMQHTYGPRSVILVSFGSFFWPPVPGYVDEVIEALIEKEAPFILCHPSSFATISPELFAKIQSSGLGLLSSWVPQHYVLTHPVTGWFLTHGGQGSVTEALGRGIPLICWPIEGDQPAVCAHLSHTLRVAFELVEVRSGEGLKPLHRLSGRRPEGTRVAVGREIRQAIDASRGEVGKEMRTNAEAIKIRLEKSWDKDGAAMKDLRAFVDRMTKRD